METLRIIDPTDCRDKEIGSSKKSAKKKFKPNEQVLTREQNRTVIELIL